MIHTRYTVECDAKGCDATFESEPHDAWLMSRVEAAAVAAGWCIGPVYRVGELCPEHVHLAPEVTG